MNTESTTVLYEVADGVATLTLNRPEKRNAFTNEMAERWVHCLETAQADNDVRAIIITGAGKGFCSGGDTSNMGGSADLTPLKIKENLRQGVQQIPLVLSRMDKPVIAAINGVAAGAGLDLALMCDIRYAATSARMGETYAKVGLVPGAGGAYFLPRLVGLAKALELFWSAELIDAQQALEIGMVNKVFADDELLNKTHAFAVQVAKAPPLSIQLIKRAIYQSLNTDLATSLDLLSSHQTLVRNSEDHAEAIAAMKEKRTGVFHGR